MFEPYEPEAADLAPLPVTIRVATLADAPVLGLIAQERNGGELEPQVKAFESQMRRAADDGDLLILVAEADGEVIAFGKAGSHQAEPEGWYLLGVVVRPAFRRRGVASELTRKRLEWLKTKTDAVYYIANAQNRVSIELHGALGFKEISRDFSFPGVDFTGGEGILFKANIGGRDEAVQKSGKA